MADADDEFLGEFIAEAREMLDHVDDAFLELEANPSDLAPVREIFRQVHSIKGAAGFLELDALEGLSHAGEGVLSKVRDGELVADDTIVGALLEMVDALRTILGRLAENGKEGPAEHGPLMARLLALRDGHGDPAAAEPRDERTDDGAADGAADADDAADGTATAAADEPGADAASTTTDDAVAEPAGDAVAAADAVATDEPAADASADDRPGAPVTMLPTPPGSAAPIGELLIGMGMITRDVLERVLAMQQGGDKRRLGEILVALGLLDADVVAEALTEQARILGIEMRAESSKSHGGATGNESIRVDIGLLDGIVALVGELVLTRNQLVQVADGSLGRRAQELSYITSSLQEQAMRTRMQRVENAWRNLPRVVRDVAKAAGKRAEVEFHGGSIELDRTIIEAIKDPLVHLVRNAIDHGLEPPEERAAHGKPEVGTITISAVQDGGHVIIEVADDGRGIDTSKVAESAVAKGLVTRDQIARMNPSEIVDLILQPGFSTAAQVTKISGRGVGMDVVATKLEEIRGSLEVETALGQGSHFKLSIPLTLAIVPALVVDCRRQHFAIPQASVVELVRLHGDELESRIEFIHEAPVMRLRERLLPLVELTDVLGLTRDPERTHATVVVVQSGDRPFGLVVDAVVKAEEIVVKPVSRQVQETGIYAGATVMGDGSAALIIDVSAVSRQAGLAGAWAATSTKHDDNEHVEPGLPLLTVSAGGTRAGLATKDLERLEKVAITDVERSGDQLVVQYRDRLLPLIDLAAVIGTPRALEGPSLRVVVTSESRRYSVGLIVDQVHDVVEVKPSTIDRVGANGRWGMLGSVVAKGQVVEVIDVPPLADSVDTGGVDLPADEPAVA